MYNFSAAFAAGKSAERPFEKMFFLFQKSNQKIKIMISYSYTKN